MTLKEKLDLFNLSEKERRIAEEKFLASLNYATSEEIIANLGFLRSKGIEVTRAREIKVVTNSIDKLEKNVDFVGNVHELPAYKEDPNRINGNGLDIFKRVKYCSSNNITYKNADGTYKKFLFDETLFQAEISKMGNDLSFRVTPIAREPEIVTLEPNIKPNDAIVEKLEQNIEENAETRVQSNINAGVEPTPVNTMDTQVATNNSAVDLGEYLSATNDMEDLEAKTTDFATIRKELEGQLAELDNYRQSELGDISFNDIEPENINVGRGRGGIVA